tara:strand:- start:13625 stop:14548 length:924 start_codon:yes stop_codon:yes gene_type:complete
MIKLNSALIGLGNIGLNYDLNSKNILTHSRSLFLNKKINFLYGVDKNIKQRIKFYKKYKVNTTNNIEKIKNLQNINFFIVSVNTPSQYKIIKKIVKSKKLKIILIEKPCGQNYKEFLKIINLCKKYKKKIFVNYHRNYDKKYFLLRKKFLKLSNFSGVANYSRGLNNNCSHILSLISPLNLKDTSIKLLNKKKNPDFVINFRKGSITFVNSPGKNVSNNEIELIDKNIKIKSFKEMGKFKIIEKDKNKKLFERTLIFDYKNYQKEVLRKILENSLKSSKNNINKTAHDVFFLLNKVQKQKNEKNNKL